MTTSSNKSPLPWPTTWYLCKYCNKAFHLREKLNVHTKLKHEESQDEQRSRRSEIGKTGLNARDGTHVEAITSKGAEDSINNELQNSDTQSMVVKNTEIPELVSLEDGVHEEDKYDSDLTQIGGKNATVVFTTEKLSTRSRTAKKSDFCVRLKRLTTNDLKGSTSSQHDSRNYRNNLKGSDLIDNAVRGLETKRQAVTNEETEGINCNPSSFGSVNRNGKARFCSAVVRVSQGSSTAGSLHQRRITKTEKISGQPQIETGIKLDENKNALSSSISVTNTEEGSGRYTKFKEELITLCYLCNKNVPISSFVLHVKDCGNNLNQEENHPGRISPLPQEAPSEFKGKSSKAKRPRTTSDTFNASFGLKKYCRRIIKCSVCHKKFYARAHLLNHMRIKHKQEYQSEVKAKTSVGISDESRSASVGVNSRDFRRKTIIIPERKLKNQRKSSSSGSKSVTLPLDAPEVILLKQEPTSESAIHKSQPSYKSRSNPFKWEIKCQTCGEHFWLKSHLEKHMKRKHVDMKIFKAENENKKCPLSPFSCKHCSLTFFTLEELSKHEGTHSQSDFKYSCSICHKGFSTSARAEIHARFHTGERPFVCNIDGCTEAFTSLQYVRTHRCRLHGLSENKNRPKPKIGVHPCSFCFKKFPTKPCLKQHLMSHSDTRPYKCTYEGCNAAYKTNQFFREHLRLHTGEMPFQCNICGKAYARRFSFVSHFRRHTDYYKRFECKECGRKCTSNWDLSQHLRVHDVKNNIAKENYC